MFKSIKIILIIILFLLILIIIFSQGHIPAKSELKYGVTFSKNQANDLGLDWKKTYLAMLDDLGVKKLRLSAYWDDIQSNENGEYYWNDLDWQIDEASKRNVEIILAMGGRLPRWPECHYPDWANNLEKTKKEKYTIDYIDQVVNRYKNQKSIFAWQVENEAFLKFFGECPPFDSNFLDAEIAHVKKLDSRPIVVTDSGELSVWYPAAKRADIFGTTMYRDTYSAKLKKYVHYPITPGFFRFKKNVVGLFAKPQKWVVIELQGEPWGPKQFQDLSFEERSKTMDLQKFKDMIEFSSQTGFSEFYLWGVEYWYWEKEMQGNGGIWEEARKLYQF